MEMPGPMLKRGFWLYVWEITTSKGKKAYYVGRTGDSSSPNANPPYNRMAQHLGRNEKQNALRRNLEKKGLKPEECASFKLISYGPIFSEEKDMESHKKPRDKVAALEQQLACAMEASGYDVVNVVRSQKPLDLKLWQKVKREFAEHFPNLK